jgi:Mg-chelatase subunit ChlD
MMLPDDPGFSEERSRRWRLILGAGVACQLCRQDGRKDAVLTELYGRRMKRQSSDEARLKNKSRRGDMSASMPNVNRWLGDIREYFPDTVVHIMQQDAIKAIGLLNLLTEPEIVEQIDPDIDLVTALLMLKEVIPAETKDTARILVRKVVEELMRRLEVSMQRTLRGALNRTQFTRRPRHHDINWHRTIRANLKHYQSEYKTVIPETLIGFGRRRRTTPHHVIICIDESGSMATSLVYSSIFGAVMASLPALKTSLVVFDTSVVDLTINLCDPVDLLFGATLGGGTDINQALGYCQTLIEHPRDTTLILISDLYEGGNRDHMLERVSTIVRSGVHFVALLALSDRGVPSFDHDIAAEIAKLGAPAFACTPDLFPELIAATMNHKDLRQWAMQHELKLAASTHQSTGA